MKIIDSNPPMPKYVKEMMSRASFCFTQSFAIPGYTISIRKSTEYTSCQTLKQEVERLAKWVRKECNRRKLDFGMTMVVNSIPESTHYCKQYAYVTIYDPIMMDLEKFIL